VLGPKGDTLRIACVGGGPAGLYFALLLKLRGPRHDITIFERGARGATRGWGVVFWGDLLEELYAADPESAREIERASFPWDMHVVDISGKQVASSAPRGYGIKRQRLLDILVNRALAAGVSIEFEHEVTGASQLPPADLIVACDGVNSRIRQEAQGISTEVRVGDNKYIWLGTDKVFDAFTFPFVQTDSGWIWAHAYGVDAESSTFIVECSADTWAGRGFDEMPPKDCLSVLEKIFERQLDGHQLIGQTSGKTDAQWLNFRTVTNNVWHQGKTVLAGDAAHTTHFAIGSGTKLAIEDAIALAGDLQRHNQLESALEAYEKERQAAILQSQIAARFSAQWFENVPRYIAFKPRQFATLMQRRRSPLLPNLSPRLYYWFWLYPTSHEPPVLRRLRKWVGPKVVKFYGRHTRPSPLCRRTCRQDRRPAAVSAVNLMRRTGRASRLLPGTLPGGRAG
jgi:2-polyprenyl-6-methoxyphenol hydroxylase-like FAD-dependent oxidoreductase